MLQAYADGAEGQKGIARLRGVAACTVNEQAISAREKLGARTNCHAVAIGLRLGLIN